MATTGTEKVTQYLAEAHATELALVRTLQAHIGVTPQGEYRKLLERHLRETQSQAERIEKRLSDLGEGRGILEAGVDAVQGVVGQVLSLSKGPLDLVRGESGEEKLLKNAKDECATEALEIATYDALEALARQVGDEKTADLAVRHREQEERMLAELRKLIPALTEAAARAEVTEPTYDVTTTGAADAARGAVGAAREAAASGVRGVEQTRDRVLEAGRSAIDQVVERAREARERLTDAAQRAEAAVEQARENALASVTETADQAQKAIRQIADAAREGAKETSQEAEKGAKQTRAAAQRSAQSTASTAKAAGRKTSGAAKDGSAKTSSAAKSPSATNRKPWSGYDDDTVAEIQKKLRDGTESQAEKVLTYERANKKRKGVIETAQAQKS